MTGELEFKEEHLTAIIETRRDVADIKKDMEKFMQSIRSHSAKCDGSFKEHDDRITEIEKTIAATTPQTYSHDKRLRALEDFKYTLVGLGIAVGAFSGAVAAWVVSKILGGQA
jgi:hypothetical protein